MEFRCNLNAEEQNSAVFKYRISCNFTVEIPRNRRRNDRRHRAGRFRGRGGAPLSKFKFSSFCSSERRNWTLTFIGRPLHYHSPYLTRNHRNKYHAREFSRNFHFPNYIFEYGKKKITNRENFCYVLKFFFSNFLTIYQKRRIFSIENREGEGKKGKEREREKERGGEERGRERERKRER